jgi:alpha-L-fucosidase
MRAALALPLATALLASPLAAEDHRMDWWREARFGMFIHWGLYSVAGGEWQGTRGSLIASWLAHEFQIPPDQYAATLTPGFTAANYDPSAWAALANRAGMKYAVFTSKHHEGFSLFDSQHSSYDVMGSPAGRDVMAEYLTAFRAAGIKAGLYFSVFDWHHPKFPVQGDPIHPMRNNPAYFVPERNMAEYVDFMHDQVEELVTGYGPIDILWWDFGYGDKQGEALRATDLVNMVRGHQPNVILNNRLIAEVTNPSGDFSTPEQYIPPNGLPGRDWETCMTINDTWGYKPHDLNFKSSTTLIRHLVDIVSKGGNYLLNVGPKPDGTIPEALVSRLEDIGDWMDVNSDSIYGTVASPFATTLPWGRVTRKDTGDGTTRLFLHIFDWPGSDEIVVPALSTPIRAVSLLAGGTALDYQTGPGGTTIQLPADPIHPAATVLVMEIDTPEPATANARYRMGDAGQGPNNLPLDSSSNGLNFLSSINSATITPNGGGFNDDAYYTFNGINQAYYDIGFDLPEDNIGIEVWVRTSDLSQTNRNVFGTGSNEDGIHIGYDAASGGWFGAVANVAFVGMVGQENYSAGEWIHLALVRDSGTTTFYVNGTPSGTSMAVPNNATLTHMAVNAGGLPGGYFGGDIAEARIFTFSPGDFDPATDLLLEPEPSGGFGTWIGGFAGLTGIGVNDDPDGDDLSNGIEYVVGGLPGVNDSADLAPVLDNSDPGHVRFIYRLSALAKADPYLTVEALHGDDLNGWTLAAHDPGGTGVTVSVTPMNAYDLVTVSIPRALAPDARLFMRLRAVFENNPE